MPYQRGEVGTKQINAGWVRPQGEPNNFRPVRQQREGDSYLGARMGLREDVGLRGVAANPTYIVMKRTECIS